MLPINAAPMAGISLMDLPDGLLHIIVSDGRSLGATCRKGRAVANWAMRHIQVQRWDG